MTKSKMVFLDGSVLYYYYHANENIETARERAIQQNPEYRKKYIELRKECAKKMDRLTKIFDAHTGRKNTYYSHKNTAV